MNKKKIIIIILVILILFGIYMLYNTFAVSTIASNNESNVYNITIGEGTTITVPKGSSKTIYFHLKNTNNGSVKYALGYNTTANIEVKVYEDSKDKVSDIIGYTENKYIKLYLKNPTNNSNTVTITSVLSYENGGDLIVPSDITLITEVYTPPVQKTTLADYIASLYTNAEKTTINIKHIHYATITYNIVPSENLINDRLGWTTESLDGGNIRYYGSSPNNYLYFNCSDYSNQTVDTCELWRIIGVFDGEVKIIRDESIGTYSWDTSTNEWSQAKLMKLLNPGYESESVGGSFYYNSSSGTCYGSNFSETSCDFTSTGIKNDITRSKIAEVTWNLGGYSYGSTTPAGIYNAERGIAVFSGNSTTWTGKVALPYPSDYGYAVDFNNCTKYLLNYDDNACRSNDWMYLIITNSGSSAGWFITPSADYTSVWFVRTSGSVFDDNENGQGSPMAARGVNPTLYLSSNETIVEGTTGSQDNPYKLNP